MKILLTMNLPYFPILGGANKLNRALAEGLALKGHDMHVVVPALGVPSRLTHEEFRAGMAAQGTHLSADERADIFKVNGVTVHAVAEPSRLRNYLMERIEQFGPEWVLLSSEDPSHNLLDAVLKVCSGKVIYLAYTVSFLPFGPQAFFPSPGRARLLEQVTGIVSISNYTTQYMREWSGLESTPIYFPCYGPGPFLNYGRFDDGLVTMINPCAIKGINIFLDLARALPYVEFGAVLTWGTVMEDRRALGALPNVRLLEPSPDIDVILAQTRVLLMPSLWEESFGLTAVEAMLRGIPVLASNVGGLPEAKLGTDYLLPVRPIEQFGERLNENMLPLPIVPEQDLEPWRDALTRLLSERELYERQSAKVRETALNFISRLSFDPFEDFLKSLEQQSRTSQPHSQVSAPQAAQTAAASKNFPDGVEGLDDLTPEQQSLLMLWLREKASGQSTQDAESAIIQRAPRDTELPLSFAQQRLWFLDQLEPLSSVYNIPAAVRLSGSLDINALAESFKEIVNRHEILRTSFVAEEGQPVQRIAATQDFKLSEIDLRSLPPDEREREVSRLAFEEGQRPFNLAAGPLLRASLLRLAKTEHVLLLTMHHIISDAWSTGILIREVAALYGAFHAGNESPLPALPIQYADFAYWQRERLRGETLDQQLSYWREQLKNAPALLELPTDYPRPSVKTYQGATHSMRLPKRLTQALQSLSQRAGATMFMTLLAAFQILLSRYSGQEDILVGSPIANRNRAELENLIGFFINTLVLRTRMTGDPTFLDQLERVRQICLEAYAHQDLPFEKLVLEMQPERNMSHSPIFQVMFVLQNAPRPSLELQDLRLSQVLADAGTAMFDLSLNIEETQEGLSGTWEYSTDLFEADTIKRMSGHFQNLLEAIVEQPQQRLPQLPLLSARESHQLLHEWNETATDFPSGKCLHEFFEEQAERTPDAVALVFEDGQLSYRELNAKANRLAHHLRSLGVGPETIVGICMDRSFLMVAALLGIMKAGGAYLPLDPDYPLERLAFMLEDASVRVILAQQSLIEYLPETPARLVRVDTDWDQIARQSEANPQSVSTADNLIYYIYTSGSTGRPKGAMLAHRGVCNCLLWMQREHELVESDRVLFKAPLNFDASVWELFWPLMTGASVVLARPGEHRDSAYLVQLIAQQKITTAHFVPSMFQIFLEEKGVEACHALRRVICGGEALSIASVERFFERLNAELHNYYGPTETSIGSIDWTCQREYRRLTVPIGRPIANTQIYLLDSHLRPVPVGVPGELYTGGVGLARGYLNRPALTAEKFLPDPFSQSPGARLYRSGDVARYLPDGNIEFLGRIDHQVKIRGLRLELGEIESVLDHHHAVRDAVVIVREDVPGDKRLVAYVVPQPSSNVTGSDLRGYLKEKLPDYMIPSAFVMLDEMPLTPNIKIDRNALPVPDVTRPAMLKEYASPRTPTEEILAGIWAEVLNIERIGVHDNFFELGGHSLLATQVMSRVRESFQLELPLRRLFEFPMVAELARSIEQAASEDNAGAIPSIEPVSREGELPLSFAQQRLWFLDQLVPGSAFYNLPLAVRLSGLLNLSALEQSLSEVLKRHEVLRTTFPAIEGEPVQMIAPASFINLSLIDLTSLPANEREREAQRLAAQETQTPFDLSQGPLLRTTLLILSDSEHVLLLTMHHIVSDGWSMSILIREVASLYDAFSSGLPSPLPDLPLQYADFAHWQRLWLKGHVLDQQLSYWREQLSGAPTVLELPTDHRRPAIQSYRGSSESFTLSREMRKSLEEICQREGVTMFMLLVAAFDVLMWRYTGEEDVVIGTPIANRNRWETEGVIGFFVNTIVLRVGVRGEDRFKELLRRVREASLGAYSHQDMPIERLVQEMGVERKMSHSPLFQVMFTLQDTRLELPKLTSLTLTLMESETGIAKFDLTLLMTETEQGLAGTIEYATDLFEAKTIKRMTGHYRTLLENILAHPSLPLSEIPLLTVAEEHLLLTQWNETTADFPSDKCLHQLFEEQVERTPDAVAVVSEDERVSYRELNQRANRLAHYLRRLGVCADELVGICVKRSVMMVVGVLGIMKAGGGYVPLDGEYPLERLSFMMEDAGIRVLLTDEEMARRLPEHGARVVYLDRDWGSIERESVNNPSSLNSGESVAYAIYTSGSTGRPKGIVVPQRAVNRLVCNTNYIKLDQSDRVAQASNFAFDAATFEIWGALVHGAQLVIMTKDVVLSSSEFSRQIREHGISILFLTTALFNHLARESPETFGSLRYLLFGGEAVDPGWAREVLRSAAPERLLHVYGPTESTTFATWYPVLDVAEDATTIPIGRPLSNTQAYILDQYMRPVPVGVHGELHLGGDGLVRAYLNRPELTAEKFVPHPFTPVPGARLYKTGDVARYLPDGNIEFVGRLDYQVKIRGFRVEPGEVEAILAEHEGVREAALVLHEVSPGEKRLVAYVVAKESLSNSELREFLKRRLPDYMVPSAFVMMEALPLTPSGKVDRRALPAPDSMRGEKGETFVPPRNALELQLAQIWEEVLKVQPISVTDNFFELGGHSLSAVHLMARIRHVFGPDLPLATLFEGGTIETLVAVLRQQGTQSSSPLVGIQTKGAKRPFFCVHPAGGNIICYISLARRLGLDQPLYGLQARGLDGKHEPLESIEEMAAHYLEALRGVQPCGPYLLGGWSLGGALAFEMARQLQSQGEEIALLALMDSPAPVASHNHNDEELDDASLLAAKAADAGLPINEEELRGLEPDERLRYFLDQGRKCRLIPADYDLEQASRLLRVYKTNVRALRLYNPRGSVNRVTLFRAIEMLEASVGPTSENSALDATLGWSKFSSEPVEVYDVPGDHMSMMTEPDVEALADILRQSLDEQRLAASKIEL
jgi:amino acid adenylation domain-containing protein